jgi:ABC-type amino acid transport substrate-binding protein/mono/diheme cytochrome c family protein
VCVDPDNPPFSFRTEAGGASGLYPELSESVAERLGREAGWVWLRTYWGKRAIRTGLLEGQCDLFFGVPARGEFMGPRLRRTRPFASFSYAIVTPKAERISGLADLRGRTVAVQFGSPPQSLLAEEPTISLLTVLEADEALEALDRGEAGAAYVWGPTAAYLNAERFENRFRVIPTRGPGLEWTVSAATRSSDRELAQAVDRTLASLRREILRLLRKYHVPTDPPLEISRGSSARAPAAAPRPVAAPLPSPEAFAPPAPAIVHIAERSRGGGDGSGASNLVDAGRSLFNSLCAHCHGPDGAAAQPKQDLRLLRQRYGEGARSLFLQTVQNGRPAKGMPPWGAALKAEELRAIEAFIFSIQRAGDI